MQQPLQSMISGQIKPNKVNDPRVLEAFEAIPREVFVPKGLKEVAYVDGQLEVAPGRFILEPMVLARLVSAAKIEAEDVVLDIGCATGYSAAILSRLANVVVATEQDPALVELATENLANLEIENIAVIERTLCEGCLKQGPFNVIMMAGGVEEIPKILTDQLAEGGRLVTVKVENAIGRGHVITKTAGKLAGQDIFDAQAHLLPGYEKTRSFKF